MKFLSGYDVKVVLASQRALERAIQKHYDLSAKAYREVLQKLDGERVKESDVNLADLECASEEAPVVKLVGTWMSDAQKRASDITSSPTRTVCASLPDRRRVARGDGADAAAEGGDRLAHQGGGLARRRRTAPCRRTASSR